MQVTAETAAELLATYVMDPDFLSPLAKAARPQPAQARAAGTGFSAAAAGKHLVLTPPSFPPRPITTLVVDSSSIGESAPQL